MIFFILQSTTSKVTESYLGPGSTRCTLMVTDSTREAIFGVSWESDLPSMNMLIISVIQNLFFCTVVQVKALWTTILKPIDLGTKISSGLG